MFSGFNFIFVPQGQEYQAVLKGLKQTKNNLIQVLPIPIGSDFLSVYLKQWLNSEDYQSLAEINILVLGLCGSLSPEYTVGDVVIYQDCLSLTSCLTQQINVSKECDRDLTLWIHNQLHNKARFVHALTSDHVIISAVEKQYLGQLYPVDVVDMEGFIILNCLTYPRLKIAILRVVSDEVNQNLPDLKDAISSEGRLNVLQLIRAMIQRPVAAFHLIRSSLKSLQVLQQVTRELLVVISNSEQDTRPTDNPM